MTMIRAHYDGKVIVPDEPVDLPENEPLQIQIHPLTRDEYLSLTIEERLRRLEKLSGSISAPVLSPESLRRENLYDERL